MRDPVDLVSERNRFGVDMENPVALQLGAEYSGILQKLQESTRGVGCPATYAALERGILQLCC
jgi:hypothetical protein